MSDGSGVECFWGNLKDHPECPHGPTLLFGRKTGDEMKYFYACSACRDRKLCNFYLEKGETLTKNHKNNLQEKTKKHRQMYNHRLRYIRTMEILSKPVEKRGYCHTCDVLISTDDNNQKHNDHDIIMNLTDEQMRNPTTFLKPLSNPKKEAQYLFTKKTIVDIVNLIRKNGGKNVLCIGAPKIHEYLLENHTDEMESLLLDFDPRFHNFFGPLSYCWYNLFNHHFFDPDAHRVFKDFLSQNDGKGLFLVCDPPFGGRVEYISQTIKTISTIYKKLNPSVNTNEMKIFFIFPYFMEPIIQFKSNPPGVDGGLKDLKMSDYKVDYENHPLFTTGSKGRKHGTPVRIFTNIPLNLLVLSEEDGYKYCKRCDKWVSNENKHCKLCKSCTSKDGRRYRHCKTCARCVKPTWKHCKICNRCNLEKHTCGLKPKVTGNCFNCNETDHISKDCPLKKEPSDEKQTKNGNATENTVLEKKKLKKQKRKLDENLDETVAVKKKRKQQKIKSKCK